MYLQVKTACRVITISQINNQKCCGAPPGGSSYCVIVDEINIVFNIVCVRASVGWAPAGCHHAEHPSLVQNENRRIPTRQLD